jgi:1,4-dihydroxy-2-naphthoate octaprenyltransferase
LKESQTALKLREVLSQVLRLGRLKLPVVAYMMFLFGVLLAISFSRGFAFDRFAWGSAIVLAAVLSVNYGNDYFDIEVDRFNDSSPISGGSGVLLQNPELRGLSKWIAICLMLISVALTMVFTVAFRFPGSLMLLVILGNGAIWFYSAPPLRLSYRGLGEITTMLAAGLMLPYFGYFIMLGSVDITFWGFIFPCILYALSIIVSVEMPDVEGDRKGRRRTLVVRVGRRFSFVLLATTNLAATLYLFLVSRSNLVHGSIDLGLVAIISLLPLTTGVLGLLKRTEDRKSATRLVTLNVYAISSMLLLIDCYFILTLI